VVKGSNPFTPAIVFSEKTLEESRRRGVQMAMEGRLRIGVIMRYAGAVACIIGIILIPVLFEWPYVVERSETLTLEENQDLSIIEVRYSGVAERITVTISASPPAWPRWYSLSLYNQSQMDGSYSEGLFGHTINQTATYDADIEGQGTCYVVFGRGNSNDSIVISADVSYKVTGTNRYFLVPGIVMLVAGIVLVISGGRGRRTSAGP
jgi:hypothetical protein